MHCCTFAPCFGTNGWIPGVPSRTMLPDKHQHKTCDGGDLGASRMTVIITFMCLIRALFTFSYTACASHATFYSKQAVDNETVCLLRGF